jgi:hypothetical protein
VQPDGHVVLLEAEQIGQFLVRQSLTKRNRNSVASSFERVATARRSCSFNSTGGSTPTSAASS